ncbi:hypothetical protein AcV5_003875 [Taiwanofungus camphoratus]|nr:hypothetical protein AcV5_003875 [Antrodia cinnamomea]
MCHATGAVCGSDTLIHPQRLQERQLIMVQIWALIVGIEQYGAHDDWPNVHGAKKDAENVKDYLTQDLGVPSSHVRALIDSQATRAHILSSFKEHLIDNDDIQYGDAIMFHYSGHGSLCKAPEGWPIIDRADADDDERGMLEVIVPYDESMPADQPGKLICSIPDRTMGALLEKVAKVHGDNITVVLDCCYSGHGTRRNQATFRDHFSVRGIDCSSLAPLDAQVDLDLWGARATDFDAGGETEQSYVRGAFTERRSKSHILMAACGQRQVALGSDQGGLFTTYWLKALRRTDIYPRSYAEILKHVKRDFDSLRAEWPGVRQSPQCEGITRDRIVFREALFNQQDFPVVLTGDNVPPNHCRIEAGVLHGVQINTSFELYQTDMASGISKTTLGLVVAKEVFTSYCYAELADGVRFSNKRAFALVSQWNHPLKFAIMDRTPGSGNSQNILKALQERLDSTLSKAARYVERVEDDRDADLVFEVDRDEIVFRRRDVYLRDLATQSPRVDSSDMEDYFPGILSSMARFNFYLSQTNTLHPLAGRMQLELHLLDRNSTFDFLDDDLELGEARSLKQQVLFKNNEAAITCNPLDGYAFVLRNTTSIPLYAYLMYFDPSSYAIELWYSPFEPDSATLLPSQTLQIGASPEHRTDIRFFLSPGEERDTSYIKVFLSDTPLNLAFMEQDPACGVDEHGHKIVRKRGNIINSTVEVKPLGGIWDSLEYKITVLAEEPASKKD